MHTGVQGEDKQRRENKQSSLHKELQHIKQNSLVTGSLQKNTAAIFNSSHCMDLHSAAGDAWWNFTKVQKQLLNFPFIVFPMVSQSESLFGEINVFTT